MASEALWAGSSWLMECSEYGMIDGHVTSRTGPALMIDVGDGTKLGSAGDLYRGAPLLIHTIRGENHIMTLCRCIS